MMFGWKGWRACCPLILFVICSCYFNGKYYSAKKERKKKRKDKKKKGIGSGPQLKHKTLATKLVEKTSTYVVIVAK